MVIERSKVQGSSLLVRIGVHIGATVPDKDGRTLIVTVVGGVVEGSPPVRIHVV
jgi:hypothetical protein